MYKMGILKFRARREFRSSSRHLYFTPHFNEPARHYFYAYFAFFNFSISSPF